MVSRLVEAGAGVEDRLGRWVGKGDHSGVGTTRLAGSTLRTGWGTQGLLMEKREELCSQLSEHSRGLGSLEQTQAG